MFPYKQLTPVSLIVECEDIDRSIYVHDGTEYHNYIVVSDGELLSLIAMLTDVANAKGLKPVTKTPAPAREFEPEHAFYPLPEYATPAAMIEECVQTAEGDNGHAIAYVSGFGLLIVEPIGNQQSTIMAMQFDTTDLRAMLALKENAR